MIDNNTKVRVSYTELGSVLKSRGDYTSAKTKVSKGKETVTKPTQVLKKPKYTQSKKVILLETPFVEFWTSKEAWKPDFDKPSNASERMKLSVIQNFKNTKKEDLLITAVKMLLADLRIDYTTARIEIL